MLWSLHETLKFIEPSLPDQLIPPKAFSAAKAIAGLLPAPMSSYYLECRLGDNTPQVDFLTCATAKYGREILAGRGVMKGLPGALLENPVWRHVHDLFKQWDNPASPLFGSVPLIWLEFDKIGAFPSMVPLPSISVCLDPEFLNTYPRTQHLNRIGRQTYRRISEAVIRLLSDDSISPQSRRNLLACFDCLPTGGQLIHMSVMLARQPMVLKLYGSVPHDKLWEYLTHIDWAGSLTDLKNTLMTFDHFVGKNVFIDLTIDDTVSPRIGIAFPHDQIGNLPQPHRQREMLLDQCLGMGLCLREKRSAFLSWPGKSREMFPNQTWPTSLNRWIDVKIVYQPDTPLEVKGYLGFMPSFSLL